MYFIYSHDISLFSIFKEGVEDIKRTLNQTIESSKLGPNQRFASSSVQPLRFA